MGHSGLKDEKNGRSRRRDRALPADSDWWGARKQNARHPGERDCRFSLGWCFPFARHPGESRDPGLERHHFGFPLALDPGFRRGDGIPLGFYDSLESRDPSRAAVARGLDPGFRRGDEVGCASNRRAKPPFADGSTAAL
jgi:hypothetical protein